MKLLILNEKASAAKNFATALGGISGFFNNDSYDIVHAHGHLLQLKDPQEMVSADKIAKYSDWSDLKNYPWNLLDFSWDKKVIPGSQATLDTISSAASGHDAIVIATDDDPSGEGDLLGWEIVNAINWHKTVYRIRFADETPNNIKTALLNKVDVTDQYKQGEFLEATGRERFDCASMQLSRIALIIARQTGYNLRSLRLGRLKSTIIDKIYRQERSRLEYVKKPFFEVRFHDSNQNVFKRTDDEAEQHRFPAENEASLEMNSYQNSGVIVDSKIEKKQQPPALLDLSHLSILVGRKGFSSKTFLATYQKMYEASILSYPRTEDTKITQAQFDQLLPLVDKIAQVIGVNPALLTHRTPRKKFLVKAATHGANRPGINVPTSLDEIEQQFGNCGREIYLAAAKSFLATLGEDYLYEQQKAHLALYPAFTCTINVPKAQNYKLIFDESELADDKPDPDNNKIMEFGTSAFPTVYQGHNPKPQPPTHSFIINFLKKNEIGTGATQESTLASITTENNALIKNTKERYSLTYPGLVQAILCSGTYIASPKVTEQLQEKMKQVKQGTFDYRNVPFLINQIVAYDLPAEQKNAANLSKNPQLAKLKQEWEAKNTFKPKEKVTGNWNGQQVEINKEWGSHIFTDQELQQLFAGNEITISTNSSTITGKLAKQTYKGKTFIGFKQQNKELLADETHAVGLYQPQNITIRFKKTFCGHTFTGQELQQLLAGQDIIFQAMDKKGKPFEAKGKLAEQVYEEKQGRKVIKKIKFWGFSLAPKELIADDTHFVGIFIPTGKEVRFKNSFGGRSFTNQELALLLNGDSISFTGTGKKGDYPVTGKLKNYTYKGHKIFGFKPEFKNNK